MNRFLTERHEMVLRRIRDIPSLPEVVDRIVQMLALSSTTAAQVAELIAFDPGLTSRVLRMVNSAAYGFQRQISSIQHAIMILGFNTVRGLVLSASIFKLFEKQNAGESAIDHKAFWKHSLVTASASRLIANYFRLPDTDDAFSAGMLHDVGKIVMDVYFQADYAPVLLAARQEGTDFHGSGFLVIERRMLATTHAEIGGLLAQKWKLPVSITDVIQNHHTPQLATLCPTLVYVVALANHVSAFKPYRVLTSSTEDPEAILAELLETIPEGLRDYFALDTAKLANILALLDDELGNVEDLLQSLSVR